MKHENDNGDMNKDQDDHQCNSSSSSGGGGSSGGGLEPEQLGDWVVHWFDPSRRRGWRLSVPQIKSCKKKKDHYTRDFDNIMYKAPYKYHCNMKIEGLSLQPGEKVHAVMDLNYEDGSTVVYAPAKRTPAATVDGSNSNSSKKRKKSSSDAANDHVSSLSNLDGDSSSSSSSSSGNSGSSKLGAKLTFNVSGVISNNEECFVQRSDGQGCEVTIGPVQFQTCSYKQDGRKFRILIFILSSVLSDTVCCLISPPLLIRAKKPIAQPGLKKNKLSTSTASSPAGAATEGGVGTAESPLSMDDKRSVSAASPMSSRKRSREDGMGETSPLMSSLVVTTPGAQQQQLQQQQQLHQMQLASQLMFFSTLDHSSHNNVIITHGGHSSSPHSMVINHDIAFGNNNVALSDSKRARLLDMGDHTSSASSSSIATTGGDGSSSTPTPGGSGSSPGLHEFGSRAFDDKNSSFEDFLQSLGAGPCQTLYEQQQQALLGIQNSIHSMSSSASGSAAASSSSSSMSQDGPASSMLFRGSDNSNNGGTNSHMTSEEKIRSVLDLFGDLRDDDRKLLLTKIVEKCSPHEKEFLSRKYFSASSMWDDVGATSSASGLGSTCDDDEDNYFDRLTALIS